MTVAIITHPDCALHDMGSHHPECPARLAAIQDRLIASGLDTVLLHHESPAATREQLCRVHAPEYVEYVFQKSPEEGRSWLDPDTCMNPHSLSAALHAAGAVVLGVDLVMSGQAASAFCNVRPPGHHAEAGRAMGFCIFDNIAVGAAHALAAHGLQRVAIVDFDVHHGNGTEDIFKDRPNVMFCSTFQHPFYPHTGAETSSDHIINVPLAAGADGAAFRAAVETHWFPKLEDFAPEMLFVSAGFDAHVEDPLADLRLLESDYTWITTELKRIADRHAGGRIVSSLEGGYALSALGRSAAVHIDALLG